jgi:hypothetical protein
MAFTGNFMCTSFKQEILQGVHNFTTSHGQYVQAGAVHQQCFVHCCDHRIHR